MNSVLNGKPSRSLAARSAAPDIVSYSTQQVSNPAVTSLTRLTRMIETVVAAPRFPAAWMLLSIVMRERSSALP